MRHERLILAAILAAAGCGKAKGPAIGPNAKVKLNYTLTVDGKTVDSSEGKPPLEYVQGSGNIIPGLEEQLTGMRAGESKEVTVTPEKGYGVRDERLIQKVPRNQFRDSSKLAVGAVVAGQAAGRSFQARVAEIGPDAVTLDLNHPLAGKTLSFKVAIVEVFAPAS